MTKDKAKDIISKWIDEIILSSKQLNTVEMQDVHLVGKEYKANLISKANDSIQKNKQNILKVIDYIECSI